MSDTVTYPECGEQTPDVEAGMGFIRCQSCGKTFSSQLKRVIKLLLKLLNK